MRIVTKYECETCGELFRIEKECIKHENRHKAICTANDMLAEGKTLKEINDKTNIWEYGIPKHLENVNKDNCFAIEYWQCCDKPAYTITHINFNGKVDVRGCGGWNGYYGNSISLENDDLANPRPKEELYVYPNVIG